MFSDFQYYEAVFVAIGLMVIMLVLGIKIGQERIYEQLERQGIKVTRKHTNTRDKP